MTTVDEGTVDWARYGQATCAAIIKDGSLARIDELVAGFKRPGWRGHGWASAEAAWMLGSGGELAGRSKKSSGRSVTGGSSRAAAAMISGMRREGTDPLRFQLWMVEGLMPVRAAARRVPPSLKTMSATIDIPNLCAPVARFASDTIEQTAM